MATIKKSDHVQFHYGICLNTDGKCSKAEAREVQKVPAYKKLECEECKKDLKECAPPKRDNNKKPIIIGAVAVALLAAGGGIYLALSGAPKPKEIYIKQQSELIVGGTEELLASITPEKAQAKAGVTWTSDDNAVVTVNDNGLVTAVGEGTTRVWAMVVGNGNLRTSCLYTVKPNSGEAGTTKEGKAEGAEVKTVTTIKIDMTSLTLRKGDTKRLAVESYEPADAEQPQYTWGSSDNKVATVSNDGVVTAVGGGTAVIIVSTGALPTTDASGTEDAGLNSGDTAPATAICKVTVTATEKEKKTAVSPKVSLSYAVYDGASAGGKPHGNGTLTFTRSHTFSTSSGSITVERGERLTGSFRDGMLNQGELYRNDGNSVIVKGFRVK